MKIRALSVNQFKQFTAPMGLAGISDGLNVVVGPNEMGKSTLLDALRAALFEKYSSKAQPIIALQNDRNQAAPVVELTFDVDDGTYRIRKRFVKKSYAHLFCPDGRKLEGDEAEDALRELLGFDEPGKTGAKPETLGMWNVLWVQQGMSFGALDLPDSARSNLHSALESEVGEVLGGKRGRVLPDSVDKQLSEHVTSTGKPRGIYKQRIDELEALRSELEDLKLRRNELSNTWEQLEAADDTLRRLSTGDRDKQDKVELDGTRARHAELTKLESQITAAKTEIELKQHNLEAAEQGVADRLALRDQIKTEAEAVEAARRRLDEVRQTEQDIRSRVDHLRKELKEADSAVAEADKAAAQARRVFSCAQRRMRIHELESRHVKAQEAETRQRAAQKRAASILVTAESIEGIRSATKLLETANSRLSAAATVVSFDMPADRLSKIRIEGTTLEADRAAFEAVEATKIDIPDYGSISVQPAIKDRDKLMDQRRRASETLSSALEQCGVTSVDTAEEQLAERENLLREAALARQEAELHAPPTDQHEAGAAPLADHIAGLKIILERELTEIGIDELPTEDDAEIAVQSTQEIADGARETLATTRAALTGPEDEIGRMQTELGIARTRYEDGKGRLEKLEANLAKVEDQISDDDLAAGVADARRALEDCKQIALKLEGEREGETLPQLEARVARLETALQDRREKRSELKEKVAGLRSHIEALEGAGLDEAIQRKGREIDQTAEIFQRLDQEVKVLSLLLSTLRASETAAKERYLSPILKRVRPYLQLLFPGAEITIDENLHITGVIRQEGHAEPFQHLSMGTQEQIAILVRLAFAEMLVEQGHPATVVLDDALVFSDDRRMSRMFDILNMVAQHVQIIVLTCREQLFEGIGGQQVSLNAIDTEELASA